MRYTYHVFSSRGEDDALLFLYDERSTLVADVRFVPEDRPLPAATNEDGKYFLYFRRRQLPEIVDLLRNEGPVYLQWDGGTNTSLFTEFEPVGAGEVAERRQARRPLLR